MVRMPQMENFELQIVKSNKHGRATRFLENRRFGEHYNGEVETIKSGEDVLTCALEVEN